MSELARAIEAEAGAVAATLALDLDGAVARLRAVRRLWLVGTGSSQHAAELGALMFAPAPGAREVQWRSSAGFDWEGRPLGPDDGVVVISHTGETALARRARARALGAGAAVVSITARGSEWPEAVQTVERERSETYTGSYLTALVVLARLSLALGQPAGFDADQLARLPEAVGGAMQGAPNVAALDLTDARAVVLAGAGPAAITAREGALKLREAARMLAEGYEAEYLLHGCAVPLDARDALIGVQPADDPFGLLAGLLAAARACGLTVATIEEPAGLHPVLAQIPLTVRAQLLALRVAEARGENPDIVITGAWGEPALWQAGAPEE